MMDLIKDETDKSVNVKPSTMHLFDLFHFPFKQGESPEILYNQLRSLVSASLKKKGDIIAWQNNVILTEDERLSPTCEELILAIALGIIDARLPGHVCDRYHSEDGQAGSLMDNKTEIFDKVPTFLVEIETILLSAFKSEPPARYVI